MLPIVDLFVSRLKNHPIPLQPGQAGHSWGGQLIIEDIEVLPEKETSQLDPITLNTILHYICAKGDVERTRLILGIGYQPNPVHEKTKNTMATPLHFAACVGDKEEERKAIIKMLLEANADPFERNKLQMTSLGLLAFTRNNRCIADMIIDKMAENRSKAQVRIVGCLFG